MSTRLRRYLLLVAVLACVSVPRLVWAHAALNSAMPADGSVLPASPRQIELVFSEPVAPLVLRLIGPDGAAHTLDRFVLKDSTVVIDPPPALANGTYALSWRVVSEDGHPVGGSVVFSIGTARTAAPDVREEADPVVGVLVWISRFGLSLGLFLGCGAAASRIWIGPLAPGAGRFATAAALIGLLCLPVGLCAQGLDALGARAGAFAEPAVWKAGLATSYAWTLGLAAIALLIVLVSRWLPGRATGGAGILSVLVAGVALASSGHAGSAHPQWLMRPAVFLHATAIAGWVGALMPLALALRTEGGGSALRRFSAGIAGIVAALLCSGMVLAYVQVRTPAALIKTAYGRVLLVKLALVAIAFLLAGINRWRLTRRVAAREMSASHTMARVIGIELAVLIAVFGTAALWRFTPPPRALAGVQAQPASVHIHSSQVMAEVTVSPGRTGPVTVEVVLMNGEFGPLPAKELRIDFSNDAAGIEPIERTAQLGPDGIWRIEDLKLPVAGRWQVELEILISDFEMRRIKDIVPIRP